MTDGAVSAVSLSALAPPRGDSDGRLYLRPLAPFHPGDISAGPETMPLAGGPLVFSTVELLLRAGKAVRVARAPLAAVRDWAAAQGAAMATHIEDQLALLAAPRPPFAGLPLDRPRIMGILNVTPDSFSDGGAYIETDAAIRHGRALAAAGADILDIGGESTRPGATPVSVAEEGDRVLPVIARLGDIGAVLSIDSRHAAVMRAAHAVGAGIFNDVSALAGDADSLATAAELKPAVILMHMRGTPETMQSAPRYDHAALDVYDYLAARVAACTAAGIPRHRIAVDPGIGFGKTARHNFSLLQQLALFHGLGCAIAIGFSRKLARDAPLDRRLPGSLAAALAARAQGAHILRVHDVAATAQALSVWRAATAGGTDADGL